MTNLRTEEEVRHEIAWREAEIVRIQEGIEKYPSLFDSAFMDRIANLYLQIATYKWFLNED